MASRKPRTTLFGDRDRRPENLAESTQQHLFEEENDRFIHEIGDKVTLLKSVSISIGDEIRRQKDLLRDMDNDMDRTKGLFGGTMKKLMSMVNSGGGKHMLYLFCFVLLVFLMLWRLYRRSKD